MPEGQLALLCLVGERDGVTVGVAADVLLMKPDNVSARVTQLVGLGLLERGQDPADKWVAHLHVTAEAGPPAVPRSTRRVRCPVGSGAVLYGSRRGLPRARRHQSARGRGGPESLQEPAAAGPGKGVPLAEDPRDDIAHGGRTP
ncbi:MarR family winged helix-turn-helix transcriptional regulator [Streptomyces sp. CB03234]|uniref:MarR family winged helix-turn-helix transcriptional regulator n=1 Tax=Streptomyces sp. (strain CB03234) TaxID=1703937 RepID=UPI00093F1FC7|nr:MarR family winged helix-turn-helix transcriptional regulator [Streptomyces sp. CB03234]